jgi:hypothetical protein
MGSLRSLHRAGAQNGVVSQKEKGRGEVEKSERGGQLSFSLFLSLCETSAFSAPAAVKSI